MPSPNEPANAALSAADFTTLPAADMSENRAYRMLTSVVVPRPVAWVSTRGEDGVVNVAPFSSFNYVSHSPPMLAVNIGIEDGRVKDSARNIEKTGHFVVNMPPAWAVDAVNGSSAEYPPEVSEAEMLGIPLLDSLHGPAPRIAWARAQMECVLRHRLSLGKGLNVLYIGEVLAFHIANEAFEGKRVDTLKLDPLARLGGPYYARLGEIIMRERP
jgi:flavin reductase (DIM6/NTAB) family NADH-FMN oxidoreductase RutF